MDYPCTLQDLSNDDYHAHEAISRSALMTFRKSPAHYWYEHLSGEHTKPKPTDDLILGNAVHAYLLEGKSFWDRYIVRDKADGRTKAGKATNATNLMEAGERTLLNSEQFSQIEKMAESVYSNYMAHELLRDAKYEQSIFWKDDSTQIACKARPDIWQPNFIADIKTAKDASVEAMRRECFSRGYHIQAAMIQDGIKYATGQFLTDFVFICIEKTPPYPVACYQLDSLVVERGLEEFYDILARLKICRETNSWPAYKNDIIQLPRWLE